MTVHGVVQLGQTVVVCGAGAGAGKAKVRVAERIEVKRERLVRLYCILTIVV